MAITLKGKNAVVTGAGRGIGRGEALALAAAGANVVVNDPGVARDGSGSDAGPADGVVEEIKKAGGTAIPNYDSVADFDSAGNIIKSCIDNFGSIDILVNNAGLVREHMIWNMTAEEWDWVMKVHLYGTFNCTRHACVPMREQRSGRIINTVSRAWLGETGQINYCAAKGGIVSFTRAAAKELGRYGITVNAVRPGGHTRMMVTPEVVASANKKFEQGLINEEQYNIMVNPPPPEYVSPMVVYLASDQAGNINGQVVRAMGGIISIYNEPLEMKTIYKREGMWTLQELEELIPKSIAEGLVNPAPAQPPKEK